LETQIGKAVKGLSRLSGSRWDDEVEIESCTEIAVKYHGDSADH
jgi:hypothetical protein